MLYSINWPDFIAWLSSLHQLFVNQVATSWILKLTLFFTWPKSQEKELNILRTKRAFEMKWKAFSIIFKGLSMKEITQFWGEGESLTYLFLYLSFPICNGCISSYTYFHHIKVRIESLQLLLPWSNQKSWLNTTEHKFIWTIWAVLPGLIRHLQIGHC